ncbi:aspartic peptidase domain-containing protein [Mucidula mucida]|nr:aspartic peptidase domain-containing protein [Mucidula mucida]
MSTSLSSTYSLPPTPFPLNLLLQQRRLHGTPAIRDGFRVVAQSCLELEARGYWTTSAIFHWRRFFRRLVIYFFPAFGLLVKNLYRPINDRIHSIPNSPGHEPIIRRQPQRKRRRRLKRADGDDDEAEGLVLPLTYVGSSAFDASYTLPLLIGSTRQRMFVQIDSGSADLRGGDLYHLLPTKPLFSLYRASTKFITLPSHAPVKRGSSPLYNPSASTTRIETGAPITITYLVGSVQGIVGWDSVGLDMSGSIEGEDDNDADVNGTLPWTISSQALAAASALTSEPLRPNFSGVLGLSPPLNSLIAQIIPATDGGDGSTVDGASWRGTGIFGYSASPRRWRAKSTLTYYGIRDGTISRFLSPILERQLGEHVVHAPLASLDPATNQVIGTTLWRVGLSALSVGGKPITLSSSSSSAILDSGVPTILASKAIADGIYGAVGVGPGGDGNYYLSCSTQISLNVTLKMNLGGGDVVFPVHPLDLTERRGERTNGGRPRAGWIHRIRWYGNTGKSNSSGGGISKVGVVALAVIGSLAGFCVLMFLVWRWVSLRRERRERGDYATAALGSPTTPYFPNQPPPPPQDKTYLFGLIKRKSRGEKVDDAYPMREMSEDEKRQKRFEEYMARQRRSENSDFGTGTGHDKDRTLVASGSTFNKDLALFGEDKAGQEVVYNGYGKEDPWDPSTGLDWGGRVGERDVLLSTEGAETRGEKLPVKEDST